MQCIDSNLNPYDFTEAPVGSFTAGVDFGKQQDYSVVVVAETLAAANAKLYDVAYGKEQVSLTVEGDNFTPGYVQTIDLGSFLSGSYRIARVSHTINRDRWITKLDLGKISGAAFTEFTKGQVEATKRLQTQITVK